MASRRILASVSLCAVLALIALVIVLLRAGPSPRLGEAVEAGAADAPGSERALTLGAEDAASETSSARAHVGSTPSASHAPSFAEVEGVRLVVVDAVTRQPVAGAVVHAWEDAGEGYSTTELGDHWMGPDIGAFLAARSPALTSDADGFVDLPPSRFDRFVSARASDRFAMRQISFEELGLSEILIGPSHALDVIVRDAMGKPAPGVPVSIGECTESIPFWIGKTDERGVCRVPDFEPLVWNPDMTNGLVAVRLAAPFEPPVEDWIERAHVPASPLELVVPASGSLVLNIVDATHHIVPVAASILVGPTESTVSTQLRPDRSTPMGHFTIEKGTGRIDGIGLGQSLLIEADLPGTGDISIEVRGPKSAGEVTTVEIPFEEDHTLLRGRIVDEAGVPIADTTFVWRRMLDNGSYVTAAGHDVLATDHDGRFVWTLRRKAGGEDSVVHRTGWFCEMSSAAVRRQAVLTFARELTSEVTDLGDIVAILSPALVSGRVVDAEGRGVPDVTVYLSPVVKLGDSSTPDVYSSCRTPADGSFALYGPCLDAEYELCTRMPGPDTVKRSKFDCRGGPVTVTLRVEAFGNVAGTLLVDRDAILDDLEVRFAVDGTMPEQQFLALWTTAGERVGFRIQGMPFVTGRVDVDCRSSTPPLHLSFAGIQPSGSKEWRPVQLVDIDLRGKLPRATPEPAAVGQYLEIFDSRGKSVPRGYAWIVDVEDYDTFHPWIGGRVLVDVAAPKWIEIWAPGFRSRILEPAQKTGRVVLSPELEVELDFAVPHELLAPGITLRGSLWSESTDETARVPNSLAGEAKFMLDQAGKAVVHLPAAGTFQVSLSLWRTGVPGQEDVEDWGLALVSGPLLVSDRDGRQVVTCKLEPDNLKQVLEELGISTH